MFYSPSLSLYEKNADTGNYIFNDVTEALWPRYFWNDFGSWHFNLPQFNLSNSYKIPIGKKISSQLFELTPFIHWQNSLFVFTAIDANTSSIPSWMTIDLFAKTITIDLSQILSIQTTYSMIFNAELVPFPSPSPNFTQFPHNYLTKDYPWYFEFSNSPWTYISSNHSYYLVFDKPTIFNFIFNDEEADHIRISTYWIFDLKWRKLCYNFLLIKWMGWMLILTLNLSSPSWNYAGFNSSSRGWIFMLYLCWMKFFFYS